LNSKPIGVLLLGFGGADSPEAIEPFMKNLMGGRVPPPALVEKIKARYGLIGGKSPLPDITAQQAAELHGSLNARGNSYEVAVGMRYWRPFIADGVMNLMAKGVAEIISVSLAPFYSRVSTGAYEEELNRVIDSVQGHKPRVLNTGPFYDNPLFIDAVAEKVTAGLGDFPEDRRQGVQVIFSAHSLPVSYIENGDPYAEQFRFTVDRIVAKLALENRHTAYQSRGGGQGDWLGPMVEEVMDKLKGRGLSDVLVVPVGFVSDHIETLYDIDIAQRNHASALGLNFHRTASLNTSGLFIRALAAHVSGDINRVTSKGWL